MLKDVVEKTNPIAFRMIKNAVLKQKVSHAFLFSAPQNYTINYEWQLLVESLISPIPFSETVRNIESYPDLQLIDGDKQLIKKEQVILSIDKIMQTPLEHNGKKILVIKNLENTNKHALNALLKFMEEPTRNTYIIMTTNNLSRVLNTIKSRSQIISLRPLPYQKLKELLVKQYSNDAGLLARLIGGLEEAVGTYDSITKYKGDFVKILNSAVVKNRKLYTAISQLINKKNALFIFNMARVFFNDIWRLSQGFELAFDKEIVQKYLTANFDYAKALKIINDFIISQENHVNFELYKAKAIIELGDCYG